MDNFNDMQQELYSLEVTSFIQKIYQEFYDHKLTELQNACIKDQEKRVLKLTCTATADDLENALFVAVLRCNTVTLRMIMNARGIENETKVISMAISMAKLVDFHAGEEILQNYIPNNFLMLYTSPMRPGPGAKALLSFNDLLYMHLMFMDVNLHPVHIMLSLAKHSLLKKHVGLTFILDARMEQELKKNVRDRNPLLAMKLGYFVQLLVEYKAFCVGKGYLSKNKPGEMKRMKEFVRYMHTADIEGCSFVEYFLKTFLERFPDQKLPLLHNAKQMFMVRDKVEDSNGLWTVRQAMNNCVVIRPDPKRLCCNCENEVSLRKRCDACKKFQYCTELCEFYHLDVHAKDCVVALMRKQNEDEEMDEYENEENDHFDGKDEKDKNVDGNHAAA